MALILSRSVTALGKLKNKPIILVNTKGNLSTFSVNGKRNVYMGAAAAVSAGALGFLYTLHQSVQASDLHQHPPHYPWSHNGYFKSFDHASIRRGYEVYKQVCSACHSLRFVHYRDLIGVSHTEEEAKAEAAEIQVRDGPDDQGKYFMRPGKTSDPFPSPYPNEEAARFANNGANPPDLSYIVLARNGNEDYIFSLLTGYQDAPAGVVLGEGQHFNPVFPGGALSMGQLLFNEAAEYSDGTPATASQLAKDVTTFLSWCAQPELDERHKLVINWTLICGTIIVGLWYWRRHMASSIKSRKILFRNKSK